MKKTNIDKINTWTKQNKIWSNCFCLCTSFSHGSLTDTCVRNVLFFSFLFCLAFAAPKSKLPSSYIQFIHIFRISTFVCFFFFTVRCVRMINRQRFYDNDNFSLIKIRFVFESVSDIELMIWPMKLWLDILCCPTRWLSNFYPNSSINRSIVF